MKFEIDDKGIRRIYAKEDELVCSHCGKRETTQWYFCELTKKLYCYDCMHLPTENVCSIHDHYDYPIDDIQIEKPISETAKFKIEFWSGVIAAQILLIIYLLWGI